MSRIMVPAVVSDGICPAKKRIISLTVIPAEPVARFAAKAMAAAAARKITLPVSLLIFTPLITHSVPDVVKLDLAGGSKKVQMFCF
jgi:hypothetical protein